MLERLGIGGGVESLCMRASKIIYVDVTVFTLVHS
jgi:hypothetical protein